MNVLFVGGSNLVIRDGLSTLIPQCLSSSGIEVGNVFNISVGATGSLFGLENLSMFGKKTSTLFLLNMALTIFLYTLMISACGSMLFLHC